MAAGLALGEQYRDARCLGSPGGLEVLRLGDFDLRVVVGELELFHGSPEGGELIGAAVNGGYHATDPVPAKDGGGARSSLCLSIGDGFGFLDVQRPGGSVLRIHGGADRILVDMEVPALAPMPSAGPL